MLALEAKLAKAESELASTRQEVELLRRQPQQQGGQGAAVVAAGPAQQRQQAAEAALRAALKQKEGETAALRTQVELLQRQLAVAASAGKGPGAAAATAAAGSSGGGALDEVRQLRAEVASLRESEQQKIADLQEAADVAQVLRTGFWQHCHRGCRMLVQPCPAGTPDCPCGPEKWRVHRASQAAWPTMLHPHPECCADAGRPD